MPRDKEILGSVEEAWRGSPQLSDEKKHHETHLKQHYYERFGPWEFNEIVGYVRLHFLGSQVRGEYYAVRRKRLVRTRTKTMVYQTHKLAPEREIRRGATNEEILQVILEYVEACRREEPRRVFDDEWLRTIGPMVDWNGVMKRGWVK